MEDREPYITGGKKMLGGIIGLGERPTYGTGRFKGWQDFFKRFGSSPIKINSEQCPGGIQGNTVSIETLYEVFKDRLMDEIKKEEKSKINIDKEGTNVL